MALLEKYDQNDDTLFRGKAEASDLDRSLFGMFLARFRALLRMIKAVRSAAIDCCCEAKQQIVDSIGDFAHVSNGDDTLELNTATPQRFKLDTEQHAGSGFTVQPSGGQRGRVTVSKAGWHRIYALVTYQAAFADASILVQIYVNGILTPGVGRHGVINNANGHISASSSVETWAYLEDGDYIDVMTAQNGAFGVVNPIAGESQLIVERRAYPAPGVAT